MHCSTRPIVKSVLFFAGDKANTGLIVWRSDELDTGCFKRNAQML